MSKSEKRKYTREFHAEVVKLVLEQGMTLEEAGVAELQRRGFSVVDGPGRRIVQEQARTGGRALPWLDMTAFLRRAIDVALDDHANAPRDGAQ